MPRRMGLLLLLAAAATGLAWAGWPAAGTPLATQINRVDVLTALVLLAVAPWLGRRVFGPAGPGRLARAVRVGGYATVLALLLVKTHVERSGHSAPIGRAEVAGAWTGEIAFLVLIAGYLAGLQAVTARQAFAGRTALAAGTAAGIAVGLLMYALPPLGTLLHVTTAWQAELYRAGKVIAVPLALGLVIAAGLRAARRAVGQRRRLPLADTRARQGLAAGLSAGTAAALVACVLHTGTIALLPHQVKPLEWIFSSTQSLHGPGYPTMLDQFEMGIADTLAGYLIMLVVFPLVGAGLGAWGGLYAAGRPGQQPGNGGGGGGGGEPEPVPSPVGPGRRDEDPAGYQPAFLRGYLHELPADSGLATPAGDDHGAPDRPGQIPVGAAPATSRRTPAARSAPP
jgi:hypothetical protein